MKCGGVLRTVNTKYLFLGGLFEEEMDTHEEKKAMEHVSVDPVEQEIQKP